MVRKVRVEVRLFATFADYAPSGKSAVPFDATLNEGATIADLIAQLAIPQDEVHLCIVNGRLVHDRTHPLSQDDRVALFPPVGGG